MVKTTYQPRDHFGRVWFWCWQLELESLANEICRIAEMDIYYIKCLDPD
jgi:hypothetical protein